MSRTDIAYAILEVLDLDSITASRDVVTQTCATYRAHPKLSFVDCYLASQAAQVSATPLFTFDHVLINQLLGVQFVAVVGNKLNT